MGTVDDRVVGGDCDLEAEALLDLDQVRTFLVEDVEGDRRARTHGEVVGDALGQLVLQRPQHMQRYRSRRAHVPGALTGRTHARRRLDHAGPDSLTRHFEEAEVRDAADLNARPVVLQRLLELALDRPVVALLLHVDEVDDDQSGEVAQPELAGNFVGRLQVGLQRRVLDRVLARGPARVDVDGNQCFGLVDH